MRKRHAIERVECGKAAGITGLTQVFSDAFV